MIDLPAIRAAAEGGGNVLSSEEILALVDAVEALEEMREAMIPMTGWNAHSKAAYTKAAEALAPFHPTPAPPRTA